MKNLARIIILFVLVLSNFVFCVQARSSEPAKSADSAIAKTMQDTCYHSLRMMPDSVLYSNKPYNQNAFKFRYNALKEQMKNSWIADALREILTR